MSELQIIESALATGGPAPPLGAGVARLVAGAAGRGGAVPAGDRRVASAAAAALDADWRPPWFRFRARWRAWSIGGWRKPALAEVARWVDGRQHLKERLSTALEVAADPDAGTWRDLVVSDAAEHAKDLDPRRLVPFRLPKATRWALVVLALGAGLGFVPEYRSKSYLQKKADQQNIKEAGRQLADLTRRNLEKRPPALEPTQKALEAVTRSGRPTDQEDPHAQRGAQGPGQRGREAQGASSRNWARIPALRKLEQAARAATGNDSQTAAGLQKQIESLQKQMGTPTGNPEALDKLKKDLEKLQEAAKGMADKNSPGSGSGAAEAVRGALGACPSRCRTWACSCRSWTRRSRRWRRIKPTCSERPGSRR